MSPWKWASALIAAALIGPLPSLAAPPEAKQIRASALLGQEVRTAGGERVGELRDIVFDARTGAIRFVTIDLGGAFGLGGKEAAFSTAELLLRGEEVRLTASPAALENVPAFGEPDYPAMRASKLIHREVRDRLHQDAGEIVDLLLDPRWRRVHTALIDLRDDWKPGEWIVPAAIEDFSLPRDMGRYAVLNIARSQLLSGTGTSPLQPSAAGASR